MVNEQISINKVALRRVRLLLGWMTVYKQVDQPHSLTQPSIPPRHKQIQYYPACTELGQAAKNAISMSIPQRKSDWMLNALSVVTDKIKHLQNDLCTKKQSMKQNDFVKNL